MKVFIENEANSQLKNEFNEKTLEFIKTTKVARSYPYPYGFILNTTAEDGDNIDAFVITEQALKTGQIVECEVLGLMEQFEKSWDKAKSDVEEVDHNVLVVLKGEQNITIDGVIMQKLTEFVKHVFDNIKKNKTRVGRFLDKYHGLEYIERHKDKMV